VLPNWPSWSKVKGLDGALAQPARVKLAAAAAASSKFFMLNLL
jgi:hypothetical protein